MNAIAPYQRTDCPLLSASVHVPRDNTYTCLRFVCVQTPNAKLQPRIPQSGPHSIEQHGLKSRPMNRILRMVKTRLPTPRLHVNQLSMPTEEAQLADRSCTRRQCTA